MTDDDLAVLERTMTTIPRTKKRVRTKHANDTARVYQAPSGKKYLELKREHPDGKITTFQIPITQVFDLIYKIDPPPHLR